MQTRSKHYCWRGRSLGPSTANTISLSCLSSSSNHKVSHILTPSQSPIIRSTNSASCKEHGVSILALGHVAAELFITYRCYTILVRSNAVRKELSLFCQPLKPSGNYMYRQFNIQQFYVLPTQTVFMCFVWIWEQTAIISLYSINWLVCITETECVYCAVRTGFLYIIQVIPCV